MPGPNAFENIRQVVLDFFDGEFRLPLFTVREKNRHFLYLEALLMCLLYRFNLNVIGLAVQKADGLFD